MIIYYGKPFTEEDLNNEENEVKMMKKQQFLRDTKETIDSCRALADSIHFNSSINKIYDVPVREICNALILDEEGFGFCQNKLHVVPDGILYAIIYLESVLLLLSKVNDSFKDLVLVLQQKYKHILEEPDSGIFNVNERQDKLKEKVHLIDKLRKLGNPAEIIDYFVRSGMVQKQNSDVGKIRNWRLKVAKYTAYAMNGGLLNGQFTLKNILTLVPQLGIDINL